MKRMEEKHDKKDVHNPKGGQLSPSELDDISALLSNITLENSAAPTRAPPKATKQLTKKDESKNTEATTIKATPKRVEKLALTNYSKQHYKDLDLNELRVLADKIKIEISKNDAENVEELTQNQANSEHWHKFRTGRITASVFKSVCTTKVQNPSITTIKKICRPEAAQFHCKAVAYGRRHEPIAYDEFCDFMHLSHTNFKCRTNGLIINADYPYFGASPDGLCSCDCCGDSCLEIKCPYTLKNGASVSTLLKLKDPYLIKVDGRYELSKKHAYYYQVQMQIFVCKVAFCNFYIWSENESLVLKVLKDDEFWEANSHKAAEFSKQVLLPEILGQYYTRTRAVSQED